VFSNATAGVTIESRCRSVALLFSCFERYVGRIAFHTGMIDTGMKDESRTPKEELLFQQYSTKQDVRVV